MRYFLDCEFDGFGGPLLSLALIREDEVSRYWIVPDIKPQDPWVLEHVYPILASWTDTLREEVPVPEIGRRIADFLRGDSDPVIITDWPDDIRHFCEVIITGAGQMVDIKSLTFKLARVDAYPTSLMVHGREPVQHNAWWDAMALRHLMMGARQ